MRVFISFLLALISYLLVVSFFIFIFTKKKVHQQEILVHTAIVVNKNRVDKKITKTKQKVFKHKSIIHKKTQKKIPLKKHIGSKSDFSRGGDIDFNDIFKKVNYDVKTEKLKLKKEEDLSRFKGIEKNLKNIKLLNYNVSYLNSSQEMSNKEVEDLIAKKLSPIWDSISDVIGEYAKIKIVYDGNNVEVSILDTNLIEEKQTLLIEKIKELKFNKPFNITVKFITKGNK